MISGECVKRLNGEMMQCLYDIKTYINVQYFPSLNFEPNTIFCPPIFTIKPNTISETSTPYTPASTSTTVAGNENDKFERHGMKLGPATALVDFAKDCKEKKLKAFSSYRSLKEVLIRYGLESEGTDKIPLFSLQTHEIQESDKHFEHCIAEILVRLKNYGTLVMNSLEAMRNEYVVAILHTAINITRDSTGKNSA